MSLEDVVRGYEGHVQHGAHPTSYISIKIGVDTWLVWLNGLSAGLKTKGLPVQFQVRVHDWVAAGSLVGGT